MISKFLDGKNAEDSNYVEHMFIHVYVCGKYLVRTSARKGLSMKSEFPIVVQLCLDKTLWLSL